MRVFHCAAMVGVSALTAIPASASVLQIDFSFSTSGTPNPAIGSVIIDNPFDAGVATTFTGITANGFNFLSDSTLKFSYDFSHDSLNFGDIGSILLGDNDFFVIVADLKTAPTLLMGILSEATQGFIAPGTNDGSVTVIEISAVPVPAAGGLLAAALGLFGLVARRRRS